MKPIKGYEIIVETCLGPARGHHGDIRVQNVPDETFPEVMLVRFPKKVREAHPPGTRFRVYARLCAQRGRRDTIPAHEPCLGI